MFDHAESRSVRRTDLDSRFSSEEPQSPDSALEARFSEQLKQVYELPHDEPIEGATLPEAGDANARPPQSENEEAYEFRLFAKTSGSRQSKDGGQGLQRIALRSPTPVNRQPGFVKPWRPKAYYLTGITGAEQVERYREAAVSGEEILEGLNVRWRGLELPWRVTVIKSSRSKQVAESNSLQQSTSEKRKRIGKKRRIAIRKKIEAKAAKQLVTRQSQTQKEAAEKEKRTRKNREKKVKKRQKDKLKKSQEVHNT